MSTAALDSCASTTAPAKRPRKPRTVAIPAQASTDTPRAFRRPLDGPEQAVIDAALAILERHFRQPGPVFDSPDAVKHYLQIQLAGEPREIFAAAFLDAQHRLIAFERLAVGTITQTSVYPREVVLDALHHGAVATIFAHNHPSGSVTPSRADEHLTQTLKTALALVDVRVLDHVIVAPGKALSMAEHGMV